MEIAGTGDPMIKIGLLPLHGGFLRFYGAFLCFYSASVEL